MVGEWWRVRCRGWRALYRGRVKDQRQDKDEDDDVVAPLLGYI